jgi:hypothetical protein
MVLSKQQMSETLQMTQARLDHLGLDDGGHGEGHDGAAAGTEEIEERTLKIVHAHELTAVPVGLSRIRHASYHYRVCARSKKRGKAWRTWEIAPWPPFGLRAEV